MSLSELDNLVRIGKLKEEAPSQVEFDGLMQIYGDSNSGNCLKVKYTADYLGLGYEWINVDIMQGENRTPDFLRINPQGQVPVIELGDGRCLAQSNAIIRYLARGTALLPEDPYLQAKVDEWLFWEQYSHEPYIAVCRFHMLYQGNPREAREPWRVERGEQALDYMEMILTSRQWFIREMPYWKFTLALIVKKSSIDKGATYFFTVNL